MKKTHIEIELLVVYHDLYSWWFNPMDIGRLKNDNPIDSTSPFAETYHKNDRKWFLALWRDKHRAHQCRTRSHDKLRSTQVAIFTGSTSHSTGVPIPSHGLMTWMIWGYPVLAIGTPQNCSVSISHTHNINIYIYMCVM